MAEEKDMELTSSQKYIKNTSTYGMIRTENLLKHLLPNVLAFVLKRKILELNLESITICVCVCVWEREQNDVQSLIKALKME